MSDHWIAISALVIAFVAALFTALQWASSYRQAEAAEKTLALQAEALRTQAEDTRRAIQISEENLKVSVSTAQAALQSDRARLIPHFVSEHAYGYLPQIHHMFVDNVGNTASLIGSCTVNYGVTLSESLEIDHKMYFSLRAADALSVIPAHESVEKQIPITFSKDEKTGYATGELPWLHIYGSISYEDVYQVYHITKWHIYKHCEKARFQIAKLDLD